MSMNISILLLGILFVLILITKIIQNYWIRKKSTKKKKGELLNTGDVINVLFNVGLLTAGVISILLAANITLTFLENDLAFTQPIINFLAGVLFIWFAIRNIFYRGKV